MKSAIGIIFLLAACTSQHHFNPQKQGYYPNLPEVKNNMTCLEYCEITSDCNRWTYKRAKSNGYGCRLFFPRGKDSSGR